MKNLNNVKMTAHRQSVSVGWTDDKGLRYHVWIETEQAEGAKWEDRNGGFTPVRPYRVKAESNALRPKDPAKFTLYKNPLVRADGTHPGRYDADYFQTRHLDATSKVNAPLVEAALREAEERGLFDRAVDADVEVDRQREATQRAERVAKMRSGLGDRRCRLFADGKDRPSVVGLIDALMNASDDDLLCFANL